MDLCNWKAGFLNNLSTEGEGRADEELCGQNSPSDPNGTTSTIITPIFRVNIYAALTLCQHYSKHYPCIISSNPPNNQMR